MLCYIIFILFYGILRLCCPILADIVSIVLVSFVCSAQIIAAQEEMLRKERELEEARKKLAQIRQQQYKFLPSELREDED